MSLPHKPWPFIWTYFKTYKWSFMAMVFLVLTWSFNEAIFPYFVKIMVDTTASNSPETTDIWEAFKYPIIGILITWTVMEASMRIWGAIEVYFYPKVRADMRSKVFEHVKGQSVEYFSNNFAGSLGSRISDIPKSYEKIVETIIGQVIGTTAAFIFSVIVVAMASPLFALVMILWCAGHMGVTFYFMKEASDKIEKHYDSVARLNGETIDIISNIMSMRLFARAHHESGRLNTYQKDEIKRAQTAVWCLQKINCLRGICGLLFIFVTVYLLLKGWKEGWLSLGDFPLVAMTSFNMMGLIWHMSFSLLDLFKEFGILKGALSIMADSHSIQDPPHGSPLVVKRGEICYDHVHFGYRKKGDLLFIDLNVNIAAGQKVGLVGFSGSGKTSFVNLLLRAYDINQGEIHIDDQNIADVTQESLRAQIAMIPQDPSLFHRSVLENIRYGRLEASDEEVLKASKMAHCHEFILNLENGYDTVVGERGLKLSGGQRQRISIARAILKDAPIIVLDEATSALDSVTEKLIQKSLEQLMKRKTTLVVAHRLSTLANMDRILVFDKGKIVEDGTHQELLSKNGYFSRMWSSQQEGFLPEKEGDH